MLKIKNYRNKEEILDFLNNTDYLVMQALEQRLLIAYGVEVNYSMNDDEFIEILKQRDIAISMLNE